MASIRRLLIAIVGLLLIIDAGALAYVKFSGGPSPSDDKSKLVFWIDDAAQAKVAAETLKGAGYEPVLKADKRKTEVETDFRVVMVGKKEILNAIAQTLRQSGHQQLSFSEDGGKLYYGGFFKQKAQALKTAERIKSQEKMVFEVLPGTKTVEKKSNRVILLSVSTNMVPEVQEALRAKDIKLDDELETPLDESGQPAAAASSESESEE